MTTTASLNSVLSLLADTMKPRATRSERIELDRLSSHDLADLNLPPDFRARIDLNRDTATWDRIGGWRTI